MKTTELLTDLLLIDPKVIYDDRGYFMESYNQQRWTEAGINRDWVQDNEAHSHYGTLRGMHYQTGIHAQAKLVRVISGKIYDVVVDLRPDSPTYKQWTGVMLSGENKKQLYIPRGYAHGYLVLSEEAIFAYKCDNFYQPDAEGGLKYDDPTIGIEWPIEDSYFKLSQKDKRWPPFDESLPINL